MSLRPATIIQLKFDRKPNNGFLQRRAYQYQLYIRDKESESAADWLSAATAATETINNKKNEQEPPPLLQPFKSAGNRVRRTSILRQSPPTIQQDSPPSPTSPSGEKKNVRFADSMGFQLESVKYYAISPQVRRRHSVATAPFIYNQYNLSNHSNNNNNQRCNLVPINFTMPSLQSNFAEKLHSQSVLLHSLTTSDTSVYGIVSVVNHSFIKKVYVRYTFNDWTSFVEHEAYYMLGSHENDTDKFTFTIYCKPSDFVQSSPNLFHPRLFFALRYQTGEGIEFWDNNGGKNYCLNYIAF